MMLIHAMLRRTAVGIVTLLVVSILIFIATSVLPGDVANIILGQMATPESLAALRAKLGLDQPAYARYFFWLGNLATGDLGISKAGSGFGTIGTPISEMLAPRVENTIRLAGGGGADRGAPLDDPGAARRDVSRHAVGSDRHLHHLEPDLGAGVPRRHVPGAGGGGVPGLAARDRLHERERNRLAARQGAGHAAPDPGHRGVLADHAHDPGHGAQRHDARPTSRWRS